MNKPGHLVIVGGAEDRLGEKLILERFVQLLPAGPGPLLVLTAATEEPEELWKVYRRGFHDLGVRHCEPLHLEQREQANDEKVHRLVRGARGVFMTGGDQKKLLALVGGTRLCEAMRQAYIESSACIAGTSAGASALSEHMLGHIPSGQSPATADVSLAVGLGFVLNAVIDQHFSERGRLARLLAVVAHNPKLVGVGIDEDTALVISRGRGIEVIGAGAVTLVDGHDMRTRLVGEGERQVFQATDVRLHMLPAGGGAIRAHDGAQQGDAQGDVSPHVRALVQVLAGRDAVDIQFRTDR